MRHPIALAAALLLSTASTAGAPVVRRCLAPAEVEQGQTMVRELGQLVARGDAEAAKGAWQVLREHACFRLLVLETPREPAFDDPDAAKWWWDHGGGDWLDSAFSDARETVVPPDWPHVFQAAKHPLSRLLCKAGDAECGRETAGWQLRAEEMLRLPTRDDADPWRAERALAKCDAETKKEKVAISRYMKWRECLEGERELEAILPLGRFSVPADGWLIVRGRRGHYHFCDELRAYDLATGAAYVAQSCSGLALNDDGRVNQDRTDDGRAVKVTVGQVPVDAIREAAWMTFVAKDVQSSVQTQAWYAPIPAGLERAWRGEGNMRGLLMGGCWGSSSQTQLAWSWQGADGLRADGTLTWPSSSDAGETHAARLLSIAEAALVEGCPPAKLPAQLIVGGRPGVSSLDASPESLRTAEAVLLKELIEPRAGCR